MQLTPSRCVIESLESREHFSVTLLGTLGQSPVQIVSVPMTTGEFTSTITALKTPGGNLVIPGNPVHSGDSFTPVDPILPPGWLIALTPVAPT